MSSSPTALYNGERYTLIALGRESCRLVPLFDPLRDCDMTTASAAMRDKALREGTLRHVAPLRVPREDVTVEDIDSPPPGRRYDGWPGERS